MQEVIKIPEYQRICPMCKKEFTAKRKNKIFCSDNCRVNHHRHKKIITVFCRGCGEPFERKRGEPIKLFCSDKCKSNVNSDNRNQAVRNHYQIKRRNNRSQSMEKEFE